MKLLVLFSSLLAISAGYKMLIIAPAVPPSQVMFNSRVAGYLAKAGHDVTIALMHTMDGIDHKMIKVPDNIKVYHVNASIGESFDEVEKDQGDILFQKIGMFDARMRTLIGRFMTMFSRSCRSALRNKEFMNWLKESKFDLAFVHMYHLCPIGMVHTANIPWIWLNSGALMDYISDFVGSPLPPSYNPPMMMVATDKMNFYERTKSLIGHTLMRTIGPYITAHPETQIFREELDPNFPDLQDLAANCSLVMVNSHPFYELTRPLLAKIVHIGGIGMQLKDVKPLPKDLEDWVQQGKGAVVLSFGSIAPLHNAPDSWKEAILKAFARLPQYQFIMRYMGDDIKDRLPPNVKIMKWLPQSDLLQHPRVKAFISHGGYNGFQETIAAGKPMIMIPLLGDQPKNAKLAERHGMAVVVQKDEVTEENLHKAINEILSNPSYAKSAEKLAMLMSKQPVPSDQLLVKWAELMAEVKHLDNMFPAGRELNFFQYHSLDVIGFLLLITGTVLFISFLVLRAVVRRCFKKVKIE